MFFRSNAGSGLAQKVLPWGGAVTFVLGVAATVFALGACEANSGDAMNHDHAVEHPAEHTQSAAEQTADDSTGEHRRGRSACPSPAYDGIHRPTAVQSTTTSCPTWSW